MHPGHGEEITYSSPSVTADGLGYVADHSGRVRVQRVSDGDTAAAYPVGPAAQIWSGVAVDRGHRCFPPRTAGCSASHRTAACSSPLTLGGPVDSYPALTADGAVVIGDRSGQVTAVG